MNEINFPKLLETIFEEFRNIGDPLRVETMSDSIWNSSVAFPIIGHDHLWLVLTEHRKNKFCLMLELVADKDSAALPIGDERRRVIWSAHTNFTTHSYDETLHQGMWFGDHPDSRVANGFRNAENPHLAIVLQIERRISFLIREFRQPKESELIVTQIISEALSFRQPPEDSILSDSRKVLELSAKVPKVLDPVVLQEIEIMNHKFPHRVLANVV